MERKSSIRNNHAGEVGTPAMKYHAVNYNREGRMDLGDQRTDGNLNDDANPNLLYNGRRSTSDKSFSETRKTLLKIGIWNVKTLFSKLVSLTM